MIGGNLTVEFVSDRKWLNQNSCMSFATQPQLPPCTFIHMQYYPENHGRRLKVGGEIDVRQLINLRSPWPDTSVRNSYD